MVPQVQEEAGKYCPAGTQHQGKKSLDVRCHHTAFLAISKPLHSCPASSPYHLDVHFEKVEQAAMLLVKEQFRKS
jgi:hypothetical protein